jgi:hypothetical protein
VSELTDFHGFGDSVRWRLGPTGLEVEGSGVERTPGAPSTVTRVWESYGDDVNAAATEFGVPCVLIVATICTESGGRADAVRLEPGYKSDAETPAKVSPGLMQTLISTARAALGKPDVDRAWLLVPRNSIRAGTAYIAQQKAHTNIDPPLVAAAYNAGSLRANDSAKNRWKLVQYPIGTSEHCDRFVKWFNDAVVVLKDHAKRPSVGYDVLLGAAPAAAKSIAYGSAEPGKLVLFPPPGFKETLTAQPVAAAQSFAVAAPPGLQRIPPDNVQETLQAIPVAEGQSFGNGQPAKLVLFPPPGFREDLVAQPVVS